MRRNRFSWNPKFLGVFLILQVSIGVIGIEKAFAVRLVVNQNANTSNEGVNWGPYMGDLSRRLKRAWRPPTGHSSSSSVTVYFTVEKNGQLKNVQLQKSSGLADCDNAAMNAVKECSPRPLPTAAGDQQEFQFTFDGK